MDEQTTAFLDLASREDLAALVDDRRAAWLFSADGARVLWANAAGAAFFSLSSIADIAAMSAPERSPARPHIARIAQSGPSGKFSIDRLRFYRGLRVMLLTCQCQRLELADGTRGALIVCGDKGLTLTREPVAAFAQMLAGGDRTVFLVDDGRMSERVGTLDGTPALDESHAGETRTTISLGTDRHDAAVLMLGDGKHLLVLDDVPLEVAAEDAAAAVAAGSENAAPHPERDDPVPADVDSDTDNAALAGTEDAPVSSGAASDTAASNSASESDMLPAPAEPAMATVSTPDGPEEDAAGAGFDAVQGVPAPGGFAFEPRRRPVRFAWKMDIDQRFTFLSDEFAEVLGPEATDIVGQTWAEVASRFDLDPRRQIARALDRRDTWSGRTVDWPVSGAALRVPVDLAALPAFDRNRKFEGYRGFGVCRSADALSDPSNPLMTAIAAGAATASGLALVSEEAGAPDPSRDDAAEAPDGAGEPDETRDDANARPEDAVRTDTAAAHEATGQTDAAEDATTPVSQEADAGDQDTPEQDAQEVDASSEEDATAETGTSGETLPGGGDSSRTEDTRRPAATLSDLKPAQPDSLAGRTFLGASAAALVGSLARFTGKPATQVVPAAATPGTPPASSRADSVPPIIVTPSTDSAPIEDEDLPGAALDSRLAALQDGLSRAFPIKPEEREAEALGTDEDAPDDGTVGEEAAGAEAVTSNGGTETESAEPAATAVSTGDAEDEDSFDAASPEAAGLFGEESPADADAASDDGNHAEIGESGAETGSGDGPADAAADVADLARARQKEDGPTGISGPAALAPDEIESAVKSLAKSYKLAAKQPRDLFEDTDDRAAPENHEPDTGPASAAHADNADTSPDPAPEPAPEPALEDTYFDIVEEDARTIEQTAAELDAAEDADLAVTADDAAFEEDEAGEVPDAAASESEPADDAPSRDYSSDDDERGFFEETAAFEHQDREAEKPRTGQVIPLATARPRVVPVDTSGLSRPERQAFRKIAEALGARLEGDLEDFDAPDPQERPEEDLPPEEPEAGPIDPSLLDRLPIGIAIVHDREVLYANKALLAMLGYRSVGLLSQAGGLEALFIDDAEDLPDAAMDGEVDEAMKLRLADGGVLNVDAHMHSVPWNGSRGLMISITERTVKAPAGEQAPASPNFFAEVRAELETARSQIAEMDTILETATDGVLVLDRRGTILKANGSAEALFATSRADMIGAPFTEFLAPESHRAAADYLDGLSRNGVASILNDGREVLGTVPAGGLIPLFMTMGRIGGGQDDAKYCAVLRDITQWKTAEEELTQAKRQAENASSQKSDFLAKISHEIRTPLNAIIGFSEVMMEERFGPIGNDRYKDYLKDIRTSGAHIMSLINDLLDLSKIEAGKLEMHFSAVSTSDVINECVALMQPQANRERVIIRASLPESVPHVVADPRSLRQIVLNLLSNAIKYNRSGGQVILSTALESDGRVALRVRDTGTGMTAKQLTAALEPFRQLHTASRGGGTGLGLPLTKALVEANRASFHIDSTPDQGTLVEITFPTQRVLSE